MKARYPLDVIEDAGPGIRSSRKGYRVGVIGSATFEDADLSISNWMRQRSRWIMGYVQSFLVDDHSPRHLLRPVGAAGVFAVFFIGGTVLSGSPNPVFRAIFAVWMTFGAEAIAPCFPRPVLNLSPVDLRVGSGLLISLTTVAPFGRRWTDLEPWGIAVVGYWVFMTEAIGTVSMFLVWLGRLTCIEADGFVSADVASLGLRIMVSTIKATAMRGCGQRRVTLVLVATLLFPTAIRTGRVDPTGRGAEAIRIRWAADPGCTGRVRHDLRECRRRPRRLQLESGPINFL